MPGRAGNPVPGDPNLGVTPQAAPDSPPGAKRIGVEVPEQAPPHGRT